MIRDENDITPQISEELEREYDEMIERMQDPMHVAITSAWFQAPFQLGQEAVRQFITETVREKFPDYEPPEAT